MDINNVLPLSEGEAIFSCSLLMGCVANNGVTGTDSTSSKITENKKKVSDKVCKQILQQASFD